MADETPVPVVTTVWDKLSDEVKMEIEWLKRHVDEKQLEQKLEAFVNEYGVPCVEKYLRMFFKS